MDRNTFKSRWQEFRGELKKNWGQLTDNDVLEAEGDYDTFTAVIRRRYGDRCGDVIAWANDWYSKQEQDEIAGRQSTVSRKRM